MKEREGAIQEKECQLTYHTFEIMSMCIVREAYGMIINNRPRAVCYSNTKYLPK